MTGVWLPMQAVPHILHPKAGWGRFAGASWKSQEGIYCYGCCLSLRPRFLSDCTQNLVAQLADKEELLMVPVKNSVAGAGSLVKGQF